MFHLLLFSLIGFCDTSFLWTYPFGVNYVLPLCFHVLIWSTFFLSNITFLHAQKKGPPEDFFF